VDQRLDVLREARAAVARARVDEAVTDARVGADALANFLDLRFVTADAKLRRAFPQRAKALGVS
jgi:hypothetical protein